MKRLLSTEGYERIFFLKVIKLPSLQQRGQVKLLIIPAVSKRVICVTLCRPVTHAWYKSLANTLFMSLLTRGD